MPKRTRIDVALADVAKQLKLLVEIMSVEHQFRIAENERRVVEHERISEIQNTALDAWRVSAQNTADQA